MTGPLTLAVPVFNGEHFLAETLASLNANGSQLRWWLQDGGSKDHTVEIARKFARDGDTVVSEPDKGQTDALNRAFPQMGGEIIGFVSGDDLPCSRTPPRACWSGFDSHPDIDLVLAKSNGSMNTAPITGHHASRIDSLAEALDLYDVWWRKRQWVQPEVFFRRSLWERAGAFDTRYQLAFDYDFWVRCFLASKRA